MTEKLTLDAFTPKTEAGRIAFEAMQREREEFRRETGVSVTPSGKLVMRGERC